MSIERYLPTLEKEMAATRQEPCFMDDLSAPGKWWFISINSFIEAYLR
jgi:hypothetical protein